MPDRNRQRGYKKIYHSLKDDPLWTSEPFTKGQAWVDLILMATHKDGHIWVRGQRVDVKRGQVAWGERSLAARWKWSRGKVRRYLRDLETTHRIARDTAHPMQVITICNFETYQSRACGNSTSNGAGNRTKDSTSDGTTDGTTDRTSKKKQEETKKKETPPLIPPSGGSGDEAAIDAYPSLAAIRETWVDWCKHRREIRKTLKPTTWGRQLKKLAEAGPETAKAMIEQSIEQGWTGLFEPRHTPGEDKPFEITGRVEEIPGR